MGSIDLMKPSIDRIAIAVATTKNAATPSRPATPAHSGSCVKRSTTTATSPPATPLQMVEIMPGVVVKPWSKPAIALGDGEP